MLKKKIYALPALGVLSLLTFYIQSLAWPLHLGRDGLNYIIYYLEIWSKQPVYQMLMLRRTPVAPIIYGLSLSYGGSFFTEVLSAGLYALSILCIYKIGQVHSQKVGFFAAILVNFYPAYGSIFHVVASEPLATFFLMVVCVLLFDALAKPEMKKFFILGIVSVLAILSRPDSLALLILSVGPWVFIRRSWKEKALLSGSFLSVTIFLLIGWSTYNYLRYDDFTIARGEKAQIPLERVFTISHLVQAKNGPASADLARLVSEQLLIKEPYRSYAITPEIFFSQGTERMFWDLIPLADQNYGWDSDYRQLRQVGMESVMANPGIFLWDYFKTAGGMLLFNPEWPVATRQSSIEPGIRIDEKGLPVPTEGEKIPRSYFWASSSSPDARALPDPNSIGLQILNSSVQAQTDALQNKLLKYKEMLPERDGFGPVANFLNRISRLYPAPIIWLFAGLIGLFLTPTRPQAIQLLIITMVSVMIFYPILGFGTILIMRARFDPLIMLFGVAGLAEIIKAIIHRIKYPQLIK